MARSHTMPPHNQLFRDTSIIVQDCDSEDVWGYFPLFLKYNQDQLQALISFKFAAHLDDFDEPQSLTLLIPPENITRCDLITPEELSAGIKNHLILDKSITRASDVLILFLHLDSPGRVIAPRSSDPLLPKQSFRSKFVLFYALCKSKSLALYFHKSRLGDGRVKQLKEIVDLAQAGKLKSLPTDLKRQNAGKGVQETDWQVFHASETPPPYAGTDTERDHALATSNKRQRAGE